MTRRIVFVCDHFIPWKAGTEHQLSMLLPRLPADWEVKVVTFRRSEWLDEHAETLKVEPQLVQIDNFKSFATYWNLFRLVRLLRSLRPDVVHTFFPVANAVGVLAAKLARVPTVLSSRRDFGEWMSPRYLSATRFANRFVSGIVTNSARVAAMTEKVEGFPASRITVIGNGIDVDRFSRVAADRRAAGDAGASSGPVIGLVANYRPMKRHDTLVRAAAILKPKYPSVRFVLVGTNATERDIEGEMKALARQLDVVDTVEFSHSDGDIREVLSRFDIAVNCSEGEGLSNAIMEYMASGLPCVVADSGGNPDLITNERTGLTFTVGSHDELALKLSTLIEDAERRGELGSNARQFVAERYSIETMVEKFIHVYRAEKPARLA